VIERKTRSDLLASLHDGRFHTQRARMVHEYGAEHVAYLVEGHTDWSEQSSCAEIGLLFRDRIPVVWAADVGDSAAFVYRACKSDLKKRTSPPNVPPKVSKLRSVWCPRTSMIAMLRCLPSVSESRAKIIANEFSSVSELVRSGTDDRRSTLTRIADLQCGGGGNRRLGKSVASLVLDAMIPQTHGQGAVPGITRSSDSCTRHK
jgi:ERCC4-type nuclease